MPPVMDSAAATVSSSRGAAQDHEFHRLIVDAEDRVAENAADQLLLAVENMPCGRFVVAFGNHAHLDAVDAAGLEGDGRIAERVEFLDAVGQQLGDAGLAQAPAAQHAAADDGRLARPPPQVGQHGAVNISFISRGTPGTA